MDFKLGVWLRTCIEKEDALTIRVADRFIRYERQRKARQRKSDKS